MSEAPSAAAAGTFIIGGYMQVNRLGFGAMRITGPGIWGPPADPDEALGVLRRLPALGVDLVDTADSYGPYVSEDLIHDALSPYDGVRVATKAGLTRSGPSAWAPVGRPEYLRQCCEMSLRRLGVETLDLFQLHRIDPKVPREEQFGLLAELRQEGKVRNLGLSEVSVEEIDAASQFFDVATVQNRFNLTDRSCADVVAHCEERRIGFIPWAPLAAGELAGPGGPVAEAAQAHGATPGQVALAWLLQHSTVMLPIPGTSSIAHLEENVAAASLTLTPEEIAALDAAG
jgi:pyridoxine 4-dehydrogenase